jgi:hypothetical protein
LFHLQFVAAFFEGEFPNPLHGLLKICRCQKLGMVFVQVGRSGRKSKFTRAFANIFDVLHQPPDFVEDEDATRSPFRDHREFRPPLRHLGAFQEPHL